MFDIAAVIADLRTRFGNSTRIVLVGTSRGTIDMAEFAARVGAGQMGVPVHALVETATLFRGTTSNPDNVFNVALSQIRVPTMIIHHVQDGCFVTPVEDVDSFAQALTGASRVKVRLIRGGFPPVDPDPCEATTFHGFLGKEAQVIRVMTRFVNQVLGR
jgi:pimeloyl-ACP methyl ester carboxylesterase